MRSNLIGFVLTIFLIVFACKKEKDNCHQAIITNSAPGCEGWGILVDGKKYPSGNIPDQFKQDGLTVCTVYELYTDARMCVCCGGMWANIKSMENNK
jgi:hypothetical protein